MRIQLKNSMNKQKILLIVIAAFSIFPFHQSRSEDKTENQIEQSLDEAKIGIEIRTGFSPLVFYQSSTQVIYPRPSWNMGLRFQYFTSQHFGFFAGTDLSSRPLEQVGAGTATLVFFDLPFGVVYRNHGSLFSQSGESQSRLGLFAAHPIIMTDQGPISGFTSRVTGGLYLEQLFLYNITSSILVGPSLSMKWNLIQPFDSSVFYYKDILHYFDFSISLLLQVHM
jgi:hypothetical protein